MQYKASAPEIEAGKEVTLSFTPTIKGKENEQVALEAGHGKKVNLMVVSDDLSQYSQLWPEYNADGSYSVKHTFTGGGKYHFVLVYKPTSNNGKNITENIVVTVGGKPATPKNYSSTKLTATAQDYSITLVPNVAELKANEALLFNAVVKQNNKELDVNSFDTYLDGKANLVIIKSDDKSYDHSHSSVKNGHLDFEHTFTKSGIYRGWMQFQNQGKVYTSDFTFDVK